MLLEEAWRKGFALVVLHGRRGVSKTRLLLEFAKGGATPLLRGDEAVEMLRELEAKASGSGLLSRELLRFDR